jgi:hypothetical protein
MVRKLIAQADVFGTIEAPQGVAEYNAPLGEDGIGIFIFMTRFIQLMFVFGGLWVVYNIISAGFIYLGAEGDSKAHTKVKDQITMSVIGLLIIVTSYGFASLIGLIFFNNPNFILEPTIQGPAL